MSHTTEHKAAFSAYLAQASRGRCDTAFAILTLLRSHYPKHHVTRTDARHFDVFGFAAAGHAELKPELNLGFDATRCFTAPRVSRHGDDIPGELWDEVKFGRWSCTWNDHHYILYHANFFSGPGDDGRYTFVLSPFGNLVSTTATHHPNTDALLEAVGTWSKELHEEINVFDEGWWQKDSEMLRSIKSVTWDDVVLDPDMKASLQRDALDFFDNEELYRSLSVPWKRGIILHGVPGNGKTLTLKALIKTLSEREDPIPSLYVKSLSGAERTDAISQIFKHARKMSPCLLVFEDLDSLVDDRHRSYFLNEVDGLQDNKGILMIGSTNHLSKLDTSITKRPSRFDRKYHFGLPDEATRLAYCEFWRQKIEALPTDVDFPADLCPIIVKWTEGFSFAYIKELFMSAMVLLVTGTYRENEYEEVEDADCGSDGCSTVVVGRPAANDGSDEESEEVATDAGVAAKEEKPRKQPKALPEVDVPESLAENLLLAILKNQTKTLLADMDDTPEK